MRYLDIVRRDVFGAMIAVALCAGAALAQSTTCVGNTGQTASNICYAGYKIMGAPTNAYVIYYGNWASSTEGIINGWLSTLGGTGLYNINTAYSDTTGAVVQNVVEFNSSSNSYHDNYSQGNYNPETGYYTLVGDAAVQAVLSAAISGGHLPPDTNGVYFVLTAWNVTQTGTGFGTFCGDPGYLAYHNASTTIAPGYGIKYALVGNPLQCPSNFDENIYMGDGTTPNGNVAADGTINLMFHELSETVTDPWFGSWGATSPTVNEVGDLCEWNFGTWSKLPTASNGARYNVTIAGVNYLIQKLFQASATGTPTAGAYNPGACVIGNMSLASSLNPSNVMQPVTLTATVSGLAGVTPTGTVTFYFGYGGQIGSPAALRGGQASITYTFNVAKNPAYVYAVYSGDTNYDSSTSPMLNQVID
ncbi:MAG: Ig-like domain repeat protein [Candidatus Sulfotelmatobacter sp.]